MNIKQENEELKPNLKRSICRCGRTEDKDGFCDGSHNKIKEEIENND